MIKYQLLHKIFGWDYVVWANSADQGIARIKVLPDGTIYYWRYKIIPVIDLVSKAEQVTWLTCKSDKYFK